MADLAPIEGLDLSLSGFSEDELTKLLKSLESRDKRERVEAFGLDAALEAARAAPRAQRGDVWALGDHRIMCGARPTSATSSDCSAASTHRWHSRTRPTT
jgi:hypothetical protein